jgi:hypothetical protein
MYTHTYRDLVLNTMDGATLTAWTPFISLLTAITDMRAGTVTEASYTGYGTRPSASFGAPANTSPTGGRQKANDAAVTFPTNTGANQDVIGLGYHTAATAGSLYIIDLLDDDPPIVGTADTADLITTGAVHGLVADQRVFVLSAPGMLLPAGLSENTSYFVLASGLTTTAFKVSTSSGGAAVDITAAGAAMFIPYKARTIAGGSTPEFAIGALVQQL